MSNSINHKIQKYGYKLQHARNAKERALYQSKLNSYKNQQRGGADQPELDPAKAYDNEDEAVGVVDSLFKWLTEENKPKFDKTLKDVASLQAEAEELIKRVQACCKKTDCTVEVQAEVEKVKMSFKKILEAVKSGTTVTNKEVVDSLANIDQTTESFKKFMKEWKCSEEEGKPAAAPAAEAEAEVELKMKPAEVTELPAKPATEPAEGEKKWPTVEPAQKIKTSELRGGGKRRLKY